MKSLFTNNNSRESITKINTDAYQADLLEIFPEGKGRNFFFGWAASASISIISLMIYIKLEAKQKIKKPLKD